MAHSLTDISQQYDRDLETAVVTAVVPEPLSLGDLDVYLEKLMQPNRHPLGQPVLVINNSTGMELARVELEGTLGRHWDKVEAKFSRKSRVLTVSVALLPEDNSAGVANGNISRGGEGERDEEGSEQSFQSAESQGGGEHSGSDHSPLDSPGRPALSPDGVCAAAAAPARASKPPAQQAERAQLRRPPSATPPTPHATEGAVPSPLRDVGGAEEDRASPPEAEGEAEAGPAGDGGEGGASAAAKRKKKKKSKKKKGGAGAAGEGPAEGTEVVGGEGQAAESAAAAPTAGPQQQDQQQQPQEEGGKEEGHEGDNEQQQQPDAQAEAEAEAAAEEGSESQLPAHAPPAVAPLGRGQWLPEPKAEWTPLSGPLVRDALAKQKSPGKGEDQWLQRPKNGWSIDGVPGEASFSVFGIFDGHGGRQVATYSSNNLLKNIMARVNAGDGEGEGAGAGLPEVPQLEGLTEEERVRWQLQATLMRRLPQACRDGFMSCDREARRSFHKGGSTATLAFVCGWELLVANCGDSCAYLDTGTEVLLVSGNHRLDTNIEEQERIKREGGEIERSTVDGKPVGPLRVWPGGLAMSRSIGDAEAGERVTGEPEVCQVTIPPGGARLIIGSDGLWDAVHPKSAANATRDMNAVEAAHRLLAQAIKADNLKDDVSIIVVDFLPDPSLKLPPTLHLHRSASSGSHLSRASSGAGAGGLSRGSSCLSVLSRQPSSGGGAAPLRLAHVWDPLALAPAGGGSSSPKKAALADFVQRGAERREELLAEQRAAEEERLAEEQAAKERQQEAFRQMLKKAQQEGASASVLKAALQQGAGASVGAKEGAGTGAEQAQQDAGAAGGVVSSLYEELANLRLTQEEVAACFAQNEAEQAREEQERQAAAEAAEEEWETVGGADKQPHQRPQRGRGRGGGPRGGRLGGRGGGRRPERREGFQEQQGQQAQQQQGGLDPTRYPPPPHVQQWPPTEQQQAPMAGRDSQAAGGKAPGAEGEALSQRAPRSGRGRGERYPRGGGVVSQMPSQEGSRIAFDSQQQEQQQQYMGRQYRQYHGQGPRAEGSVSYAQQEQQQQRQQGRQFERRSPRGEAPHEQQQQQGRPTPYEGGQIEGERGPALGRGGYGYRDRGAPRGRGRGGRGGTPYGAQEGGPGGAGGQQQFAAAEGHQAPLAQQAQQQQGPPREGASRGGGGWRGGGGRGHYGGRGGRGRGASAAGSGPPQPQQQ